MSLSIGIVGLPNVGKSTLFNALTREQNAAAENYPFCTIEPNKAMVPVPDQRLHTLQDIVSSEKIIHSVVNFVDIAGLVKGASKGEGLGNQFLGNIRDVDAILHVVRCFDDENVVHVNAKPDPADDIEVINTELALSDLQQLEKRMERLSREVKGDKKLQPVYDMAIELLDYIGEGKPLWTYPDRDKEAFIALNREMRFLTAKPVIYAANVSEEDLNEDNEYVASARKVAKEQGAEFLVVCASLEQEMTGLSDEEREEYLELYSIKDSGLDRLIQTSFRLLGLISYFTFNEKEIHAWTIHQGWTAPKAAGVIHTDFERGFIRAEVIPYDVYIEHQDRNAIKSAGLMRVEGQDYIVEDGDILLFRFNV